MEAERPEGEAAVYFRIGPRLTIMGVFPSLLRVGQMFKFMYKLHVKDWLTVYLGFRVKMLIYIIYCELNYVRMYQSLQPRVECIRAVVLNLCETAAQQILFL